MGTSSKTSIELKHYSTLLILALCTTSCLLPPPVTKTPTAPWPEVYEHAIMDALNPEPEEEVDNLIAIIPNNPLLEWKAIDAVPHVKMVSVTSDASYYENNIGQRYNTGNYDIWVTAAPELKNTCTQNDFDNGDIIMRLRQLLGLTPTAGVKAIVEFWVPPTQLFRPAADFEINDSHAGLKLPDDTPAWYRKWFNQLRAKQYFQSETPSHNAYPWTQLGYTYDWGNPKSIQGLSEFVIKSHADITVETIYTIEDYCKKTL